MRPVRAPPARILPAALYVLLLAAPAPGGVELLSSERAATIHAEAWEGFRPENPLQDSCGDAMSWDDASTVEDLVLQCSVSPGYGYARSHVSLTSVVNPDGFSTAAGASGTYLDDNFLVTSGEFLSTFLQTYEFRVTGAASFHVLGTLRQEGGVSEFTLWKEAAAIAWFAAPVMPYETILNVDEMIPLDGGDYRCVLSVRGTGLPYDDYGGAGASIDVVITGTVGVEPSTWTRIKGIYR